MGKIIEAGHRFEELNPGLQLSRHPVISLYNREDNNQEKIDGLELMEKYKNDLPDSVNEQIKNLRADMEEFGY